MLCQFGRTEGPETRKEHKQLIFFNVVLCFPFHGGARTDDGPVFFLVFHGGARTDDDVLKEKDRTEIRNFRHRPGRERKMRRGDNPRKCNVQDKLDQECSCSLYQANHSSAL